MKKVAFLQPKITHYRQNFYRIFAKTIPFDIFTYADEELKNLNCKAGEIPHFRVRKWNLGPIPLYFPWKMLSRQYGIWVIGGYWFHPATWLLLLTGRMLGKKILIWGHGVSGKRYMQEVQKPTRSNRMVYYLSSGAMFYTETELQLWQKIFPGKPMVAVENTIGNIQDILAFTPKSKAELKKAYHITTPYNFIFCARFNSPERHSEYLLKAIQELPPEKFGFIIIGAGRLKPDFSAYPNVYDYGQLYDDSIKRDLFSIADAYFQPAWLGLSLVETMAYGLPVFSLKRSTVIHHGVEYSYIEKANCGILAETIEELIGKMKDIDNYEIRSLGMNGKKYASSHLTAEHMVQQTEKLFLQVLPALKEKN